MTLVLTASDVQALLPRDLVRAAVEQAHADLARGLAEAPAPPVLTGGDGGSHLAMVARHAGLVGVKVLSDLPGNRERGLPVQRSTLLVVDETTGECLALVDGRVLTAVRTAAASAVATRHLARPESRVLGLVGAGTLAVEHTLALREVLPLDTVVVWSRSARTVEEFRGRLASAGVDLAVKTAAGVEEVVRSCDVLCTLTPSREPLVHGRWFGEGLHVNAVGAPPRADHREVDGEGLARAHVVLDGLATARAKSGELLLAAAEGAIDLDDVTTELGQVVVGDRPGRSDDREITLFDSVGLGLQDVAVARLLLDRAAAGGAAAGGPGVRVDLTT